MSRVCSSCNADNVDEAKFCRVCGKQSFQTQENTYEVNIKNHGTNNDNNKSQEESILDVKKNDTVLSVHPDYIHYCEFMKKIGVGYE